MIMILPILTALGSQWVGWGDWEPSKLKGCSGEKMRDEASLQALLPPSKVIKSPVLLIRFVWGYFSRPGKARVGARPGSGGVVQQLVRPAWGHCVCQLKGQEGGELKAVGRFLGHLSTLQPLQVPGLLSTQRWQKADEQQCVPDAPSADTGRDWTGWGSSPQPWYLCRLATNQGCSQGSSNWWMGSGWFGFFLSDVWFPTKLLQWPKSRVDQALRHQVASRSPHPWGVVVQG